MGTIYEHDTGFGPFRIESRHFGWVPTFRGEALDGYFATPEAALRDLLAGISDATPFGSAAQLGAPRDLNLWRRREDG